MKINEVKINAGRRTVDVKKVKELAESIKELGLLNPITVNEDGTLIAGMHRLEACKLLGYEEIKVNKINLNLLLAELAEIDENLIRNELHWLESDKQLKRRKAIYEQLRPETKHNSKFKGNQFRSNDTMSSDQKTFTEDTADKLGQSQRNIQRSVARAENIIEEVEDDIKELDITKTEGTILARFEPEQQKKIIEVKKQKTDFSIKEIVQEIKKEEKKEIYKAKIQETRVETTISENIKQGDCLEILHNLENGCIDIVLTDPPYGINYISNRSIYDNSITKRGLLNDNKEYAFDLLEETCKILKEKTAENAHLYFFCSWNVFSTFENIISKYFDIKTPIIWDKQNKGSGDLENDWGNQTEIIIYCVKGKKLINNRRGNIISVPRLHSSKMLHPTQKPNELLKQILEVSATKGDFIVDPFMGSGSTIKVCNELNLKSLGIELDYDMFNIANNYING